MTREAKWTVTAIAAAGLAALILLVARPDRDENPPETDAVTRESMPEMAGMEMDAEQGTIRLTADQIRTFGVTYDTVERRPIERTIRAVGLVDFDETRMAIVAPKIGGFVERLYVDFTGKALSRGQPLLEIYSPELVSAQEELLLARRLAETVGPSGVEGVAAGSTDLVESAKRRLRYWDISEAQIERVLATGEVQKTLTLHAPVSGIVLEKNVLEGQAVRAGESLYRIADLSEVWIEAEVFEADLAFVQEGMDATVAFAGLPGTTYGGRVEYVYPTIDQQSRTMRARIALPNPGGRVRPGMYATVTLKRVLGEVLAIPRSAVLWTGEKAVAFVDIGEGRLMPHELSLGREGEDHVEVLAGVDPGMRVVTSAQYLIDSESNLAEVMRAMMAHMNVSDMREMPEMEGMQGMDDTQGMQDMEGMPGMDSERMRAPAPPRRP
ncbi:MAG TPA: efflux RND transporter periplasmic adaptor subunit [Gemmatimonadota bacterium]|nr:efflux RND transporter periplasmic adaptor subunit [Gemmatimonadota bacterium]